MLPKPSPKLSRTASIRLRSHAVIVAASMVALIVTLGTRAYLVAGKHAQDMRELSDHDLKAQGILDKLEALLAAKQLSIRKLEVTGDPAYERLAVRQQVAIDTSREELQAILGNDEEISEPRQIQALRDLLHQKREAKLRAADQGASGLLRLILTALLLSIGIAAWLVYFFLRGLMAPLNRLKDGISRIRSGELTHRIGSAGGVSELIELRDSFNSMAERLETLELAKAEFFATISHEFKNPLAALKEGLALLSTKEKELAPETRAKAFAACLIASKRLESMMNNLMRQAKIENGLYTFELAVKELRPAVDLAIQEVMPLATKKGMSIRLTENGTLRAAFNHDGLAHALENLLLNAIKYGTEKSVIEVQARQVERNIGASGRAPIPFVEIAITNQGRMMGPTEQKHAFDRFYRGPVAGEQQGLGLGLHVVKRIIEAHHGQVQVSSNQGRNTFSLVLPCAYDNASIQLDGERSPPPKKSPPGIAPVLVTSLLALVMFASGCATLGRSAKANSTDPRSEQREEISMLELEQQLEFTSGGSITVQRRALKSLLQSLRDSESRCRLLSSQLKALKDTDLEKGEVP